MYWHKAFQRNNYAMASKVAQFMNRHWAFDVTIEDGHINRITKTDAQGNTYQWNWAPGIPIEIMIDTIQQALGISSIWTRLLEAEFESPLTIGKSCFVPFPKDKPKQPPAAASSPSAEEGSSLSTSTRISPNGTFGYYIQY